MRIINFNNNYRTLYDQQGSAWTLQADELDLGFLTPEQMGVVNPILILIFVPLFEGIFLFINIYFFFYSLIFIFSFIL